MNTYNIMFHDVVDAYTRSGFQNKAAHPYKHSTQQFEQYLHTLTSLNIKACTINDLDPASPENRMLFTFDDGGLSFLHAADFLERFEIRGHFFITTNRIGAPYFIDKSGIRNLLARGHIIGSHSHTHPHPFCRLTAERQKDEFMTSKHILEDITGERCITGSIPGGDIDSSTYVNIANLGYDYIFTSEITTKQIDVEGTSYLGRICPKSHVAASKLPGMLSNKGLVQLAMLRKFKCIIKSLLSIAPAHKA
ncbi:polysaccharide deacetylase family protein [Fundidesulfovibrio magnetotacticus]|nr:polysaccharide deacetylase family protein [Fundidesulfovibrio magnetotacticus]